MYIYIVYELRNREYDTALLLKCELEERGYKVEIINKQKMFRWFHKDAIVIIPNCYTTANYEYYNYLLNVKNNFIINLQVEQVISKKSEENGFFNPKGKAKDVIHLCWGANTYNRLLRNNINSNNLYITGALQLDFLRPEFRDFWYSRSEIAKMYKLPENKKWVLYISSFAYVNNEVVVKNLQKDLGGEKKTQYIKQFEDISIQSQDITLDWLERLVVRNNDIVVIYRNHPVEKKNNRIINLTEKYKNSFYNISDLNVKQWIQVSDQVITWFSTSIIESYMAKKMCHILRPIVIPSDIDSAIFNNASNIINSYHNLETIVVNTINADFKTEFPISSKNINEYYKIDERPSFIKIADIVDKYSSKKICKAGFSYTFKRFIYLIKNHIILKQCIKIIYEFLYSAFGFQIKNDSLRKHFAFENLEVDVDNQRFYREDEKHKLELLNRIRGFYNE